MSVLAALPLLLAHEGGWDEAAILLGPVIVFLVLRRMGRNAEQAAAEAETEEGADAHADDPADEPT